MYDFFNIKRLKCKSAPPLNHSVPYCRDVLFKPLGTILPWCWRGSRGVLVWASLSDGCIYICTRGKKQSMFGCQCESQGKKPRQKYPQKLVLLRGSWKILHGYPEQWIQIYFLFIQYITFYFKTYMNIWNLYTKITDMWNYRVIIAG